MSDEHNQNGGPENAPWWANAGMKVAINFGVPTLMLLMIFVFFFAREMGWVPNPVAEELKELKTAVAAGFLEVGEGMQQNAGHSIRHDATTQELLKHSQEVNKRDQIKCVKNAKTDEERVDCLK